jgi:hypothetical protein
MGYATLRTGMHDRRSHAVSAARTRARSASPGSRRPGAAVRRTRPRLRHEPPMADATVRFRAEARWSRLARASRQCLGRADAASRVSDRSARAPFSTAVLWTGRARVLLLRAPSGSMRRGPTEDGPICCSGAVAPPRRRVRSHGVNQFRCRSLVAFRTCVAGGTGVGSGDPSGGSPVARLSGAMRLGGFEQRRPGIHRLDPFHALAY